MRFVSFLYQFFYIDVNFFIIFNLIEAPITAELEKENNISENCFVKERDDFDQNKKTKNKKKVSFFVFKIFQIL